ncbi:ADP-ribosylglycohydrolase family protein [Mesorhizobium sp. ISC11]|uniref:ADP-ribosylglycohydrolase family protein n=1 Tax=Mesorhizobium sp. ISC11 TaxID=3076428 RepID=UPI00301C9BB0
MASKQRTAVIGSALWAAAGDAMGWITELGSEDTVRYRTGNHIVDAPVEWRRRIGGRFGPTVVLPAGTYSDDTQLRLAVSRAIRGSGEFDVEVFAKVELPVWASYSLGAGRGTTAAAANLTKNSVNWFNNFFGSGQERGYFQAGGNGAAMRIQPHVWKGDPSRPDTFLADVLRDAVTTHGHPTGFCGAVFHSQCVAYALSSGRVPGPREWVEFIGDLEYCTSIIRSDEKLGLFWLGAWEERARITLPEAIKRQIDFGLSSVARIEKLLGDRGSNYSEILQVVGGFADETRGAGFHTAIAAAALSTFADVMSNEDVLRLGANSVGSDTDTISSMSGAIIGAVRPTSPNWPLQDAEYLVSEATRLVDVSQGKPAQSFGYPDLISWSPPGTQSDAVGLIGDHFVLAGLGTAVPFGQEWQTNDAVWQWMRLEFGQTVFTKRRQKPRKLDRRNLPSASSTETRAPDQPGLFPEQAVKPDERKIDPRKNYSLRRNADANDRSGNLDDITSFVIERDFAPEVIGAAFLELSERPDGINLSVAFAAIISKALIARRKRGRR